MPAMALSFLGLLAGGVGFVFTSVWFWQVAAFSFATVFTQRYDLDGAPPAATQSSPKASGCRAQPSA